MAGHTGEGAEQQLRPSTVLDAEEKQSSGMERLIKREQLHHIKNSEKRILARKLLNINSVLKTLLGFIKKDVPAEFLHQLSGLGWLIATESPFSCTFLRGLHL
uniref:Uncharacterized protein LOC104236868 isoform X2 n=1 Tax=Nicotiana sylvestris TaxID=4096 RepID=A0A1U7XHQ9_NICSY|nr:PREDICTED: uncharacterized protein LOC104236868 isoform X2 [Nicotiana sylvestris]